MYCLVPSVLLFIAEAIVWMSGGAWAAHVEATGGYLYDFTIPSIDYNFPILLWLVPFYYTSTVFFVIAPIIIYLLAGKGAMFRTIISSFFIFGITFILYFVFPASSKDLAAYWLPTLQDNNSWFAEITKKALTPPGMGFAAFHSNFPSMHCSNLAILSIGFFDGFFMDHFIEKKRWSWTRYIFSTLFLIYSILTIISTFSLKQHFFVDWIISVSLAIFFWNVWKWTQKICIRHNWMWVNAMENAFDSFAVALSVTNKNQYTYKWCINIDQKYTNKCVSKKDKIKHDFTCIGIVILTYFAILLPVLLTSTLLQP